MISHCEIYFFLKYFFQILGYNILQNRFSTARIILHSVFFYFEASDLKFMPWTIDIHDFTDDERNFVTSLVVSGGVGGGCL